MRSHGTSRRHPRCDARRSRRLAGARHAASRGVVAGLHVHKVSAHYVCFNINGSGTYVSTFAVIRGKLDWGNDICNNRAKVVVRHRGSVIWRRETSLRRGCEIFRVVRTIGAYRRFPSPSYACGSFYENGVLQATACNWIHD